MPDITLQLAPDFVGKSKEELLKLFDAEVARFDKFMESLPGLQGGGLHDFEKVLLKTYLVQKHLGRLDEVSDGS